MGVARLVVIEGPDLGAEFEIPLRGGGIGREPGCVVQLADLSVSRSHCTLEFRNGQVALIDGGSRNRTLVNGHPITVHLLRAGDKITVGTTRLAYLPSDGGASAVRKSVPGRVTVEVGSRELWQTRLTGADEHSPEQRARRQLASLARLGDRLRTLGDRDILGRAACDAARAALGATRAFLFLRDATGRMVPKSATIGPSDSSSNLGAAMELSLGNEVISKVLAEGKAIGIETATGPALAAPLFGASGDHPIGLLYVDHHPGPVASAVTRGDSLDVMAVGCLAHLISAALVSFDAREALTIENQALNEQLGGGELIGDSPRARTVLAFIGKVGPADATVLLTGESGSGKEMLARAIHRASRRKQAPFIAVNCAALTESLIESELFGHEKGAFTGATERKLGRFELADTGTLFLDEVGELPLACQTKFLRVLEERTFERVGGGRPISVDVRVIAATNRNLPDMVRRGLFRDDLYYRLSVIHTVVPPLRERASDIPALAEFFLGRLRSQVARRISGFTPEAMQTLMHHAWPGNVRELKNAVEHAIVLGDGEWIKPEHLPPHISGMHVRTDWGDSNPDTATEVSTPAAAASPEPQQPQPATSPLPAVPSPPAARPLRELEREGIIAALRATGGNKMHAAAILQIDRSTLYKKIKDYGIDI